MPIQTRPLPRPRQRRGTRSAWPIGLVLALAWTTPTAWAAAGLLQFSGAGVDVAEADAPLLTITVTREAGTEGAIAVDYALDGGLATPGSDFLFEPGSLQWADGDSSAKSFTLQVVDDEVAELIEHINLRLSNASGGAALGTLNSYRINILDDDPPPQGVLEFSGGGVDVSESSAPTVTVEVVRNGGSAGAVSVDYVLGSGLATPGSDFTFAPGTLHWPEGDNEAKSFTLSVVDDSLAEGIEHVLLQLQNAVGGAQIGQQSSFRINIDDDDPPPQGRLEFATAAVDVNENEAPTVAVVVERNGGSQGAVTVQLVHAGGTASLDSDVEFAATTLDWADGEATAKSVSVRVLDDTQIEPIEHLLLELREPGGGAEVGAASSFRINIVSDDLASPGQLGFTGDISVIESAGFATLQVRRDAGNDGAVGVSFTTSDGSAVAGQDYVAQTGLLTWQDGDASTKAITIALVDDGTVENEEAFGVELSAPTGGAKLGSHSLATVRVVDDDDPQIFIDGFEPLPPP